MSEWYRTWFDSPYYDILYKNRDQREADGFIQCLIQHLSPPKDSFMLDLACGSGRYSIALSKRGYRVTGIDLSPTKIMEAEIVAKRLEIGDKRLSFMVHDMRKPLPTSPLRPSPFGEGLGVRSAMGYDYLFNLFTSFGYFDNEEENKLVLTNIYNSLKKGGIFVIDYVNSEREARVFHRDKAFRRDKACLVSTFKIIDGIQFTISKHIMNDSLIKEITVQDGDKEYHFTEKVSIFPEEKLKEYITGCGLTIKEVFGDYTLGKFDAKQSPRLIIVSEKPI